MARSKSRVGTRPVDHAARRPSKTLATGLNLIEHTELRFGARLRGRRPSRSIGLSAAGGGIVHSGPGAPAGALPDDVPLIQYTLLSGGARSTAPILLIPGSHQDAVDHCLIAQLAAERMACRVEVGFVSSIAHELGLAVLPESGTLERSRASLQKVLPPTESDLSAVLSACSEAAAEGLGRPPAPAASLDPAPARLVIVTLGWFSGLAEDLARRSDGRVGHLDLRLLRPFPSAQVRRLLEGAEVVLLAAPRDSALHFEASWRIGEATTGSSVRMVRLTDQADSAEFLQALSAGFPSDVWAEIQAAPVRAEVQAYRVGALPSGPESADLLLELGAHLAERQPGSTQAALQRHDSVLVTLDLGRRPAADHSLDLLVLLDDHFVYASDTIRLVKDSGAVVIPTGGRSPQEVWGRLSWSTRRSILDGRTNVLLAESESPDRMARDGWAGQLAELLATGETTGVRSPTQEELEEFESALSDAGPAAVAAETVAEDAPENPTLVDQIRHFHLSGHYPPEHESFSRDLPLEPYAVLRSGSPLHTGFPFLLPRDGQEPEPLSERIERWLEGNPDASVVPRLLPELMQLADRSAGTSGGGLPVTEALDAALSQLSESAELSEAGRRAFVAEAELLRASFPQTDPVVGFRSDAWFQLYRWAIRRERQPRIGRIRKEAESLINRLEELLAADRGLRPEARSARSLASTLGAGGLGLIDPERLAGTVSQKSGSRALAQERLQRIEQVLSGLRRFAESSTESPELFIVSAQELSIDAEGLALVQSSNPFEAALGLFEGLAQRCVSTIRALRVARLEVEGAYESELHDETVRELTWESLEADELAILPGVLVVETGRRLSDSTLAEFHRLIETGWPLHVCVSVNESLVGGNEAAPALSGVLPDPGYFGLAQREAFVLQSTLGRPDHLITGFERMCRTPGPAVCVLSFPEQEGRSPWLWGRCQTAWLSRSSPLFVYDPWAGESWADRFELEGIPEAEGSRGTDDSSALGTQDAYLSADEALTFAHVLAQDPRFREQFWVIPSTAWSDGQKLVGEFLRDFTQPALGVVPFIWVEDAQGRLQRAIVTREVVSACRDRERSWRILQELAGIRNAYVERAVERVREETERQALAEIERVRSEARLAGAEEAVSRLVEVLSDIDALEGTAPTPAAIAAPREAGVIAGSPEAKPASEETSPPPEPQAEAETDDEGIDEEAYIDSFLCTSCNECINLNPRMFGYNGDRQAFVADASAGTFAELVKAAEACPARCIHPGTPSAGDTTASPEVVERSKAFR